MKKTTAILVAILMAVLTACAGAEAAPEDLFQQIEGRYFDFCSGAGAWDTELNMGENGAFNGLFHDSEMGETGKGYPDGTVYGCTFHGQLVDPQRVDAYTWTAGITWEMDEGQAQEMIEDGIRFVTSEPYGLGKAETVTIFLPGTPMEHLPEAFLFWTILYEIDPEAETFPYYGIWNETDDAGFVSIPTETEDGNT